MSTQPSEINHTGKHELEAEAEKRTYEGRVQFADDSVLSLQCFEDRHGECPDITGDAGELDGYNCECHCHGGEK